MANLGPMGGQAHHFRNYASEKIPYAIARYQNEMNRLYGVMERRLTGRDCLAGDYSIADIACFPWARNWEAQGQNIEEFPRVKAWLEWIAARPAVQRALQAGADLRAANYDLGKDEEAKKILFGQRARK